MESCHHEEQHPELLVWHRDVQGYRREGYGKYNLETQEASVDFIFLDYLRGGVYILTNLRMIDTAGNTTRIHFNDPTKEKPSAVEIKTVNPDTTPPVIDLNHININAEPTNPEAPNGETLVTLSYKAKDDISGYAGGTFRLRDPHGGVYEHYTKPDVPFTHYFQGDPTVYKVYEKKVLLPIGSIPGKWGLIEMRLGDKAGNKLFVDFTEITRFGVIDVTQFDVNTDGEINILDLVIVAQAFGKSVTNADVNGDGVVNILDLVAVANNFQNE